MCNIGRVIVVSVVIGLSACAVRADDMEPVTVARNRCILVLLNPRAGSTEKVDACRMLGRMGPDAIAAGAALARQTLYDMQPVRDEARSTLIGLVGVDEAARLIAKARQDDPKAPIDLSEKALNDVKDWNDLIGVAIYLRWSSPDVRLAGASAAIRVWGKNRALPAEGQLLRARLENVAGDVLGVVAASFARLSVEERRTAVELAAALGVTRREAVPLLVRALADDDEKTRELAKKPADDLFLGAGFYGVVVSGLFDLASGDGASEKEFAVALKYIRALPKDLKPLLVETALERLAAGRERAPAILRELGEADTPAFIAASLVAKEPVPAHRARLSELFEHRRTARDVQNDLFGLLTDGDGALRYKAAKLAATDPKRFGPASLIDALIEQNQAEVPEVIRLLIPDVKTASTHMTRWLREGTWEQKRLAIRVLKAVGFEGDEVRSELNRVIDLQDHETRMAAAELLGRQGILNRARVPQLLADLQSDNHTTRVRAARQLDDLGVEPKEITAALIRAVDHRDLAARVGLIDALTAAHQTRRNSLDVLKESAARPGNDPARQAYARAALREVTSVAAK
jgi:hypothetical protein